MCWNERGSEDLGSECEVDRKQSIVMKVREREWMGIERRMEGVDRDVEWEWKRNRREE